MSAKFSGQIGYFSALIAARQRAIFLGVATALRTSVVDGSPITTAPGQPVDEGNLRTSWTENFPKPDVWELTTNVVYAPGIEDGVDLRTGKRITLRSEVGGFHSVKLTRAAFPKVVRTVVQGNVRRW